LKEVWRAGKGKNKKLLAGAETHRTLTGNQRRGKGRPREGEKKAQREKEGDPRF